MQADHQRRQPGRQPVHDRVEDSAEIEAVHKEPRHHIVQDADVRGPLWPRDRDDGGEQQDHRDHPHRQERRGLGVLQSELAADEAGRPQHHEPGRRGRYGKLFGGTGHACLIAQVAQPCVRSWQMDHERVAHSGV